MTNGISVRVSISARGLGQIAGSGEAMITPAKTIPLSPPSPETRVIADFPARIDFVCITETIYLIG